VAGVAGRGIERRISGRSMIRLREAPCSEVNLSRAGVRCQERLQKSA
jgi:hypothetical protein